MKAIPREAKEITLAVLWDPDLHYRSCFENLSGRPERDCKCELAKVIKKILLAQEEDE